LLTSAKDLTVIAIQNSELDDQPHEPNLPKARELMIMAKDGAKKTATAKSTEGERSSLCQYTSLTPFRESA
jgi:hypothetical protein